MAVQLIREPLSREQVIAAVERTGCASIPLALHKWWGDGLVAKYGDALREMAAPFPDDVLVAMFVPPGESTSTISDPEFQSQQQKAGVKTALRYNPEYRWGYLDYSAAEAHSIGRSKVLLPDWNDLDRFIEEMPSPHEPGIFEPVERLLEQVGNRYRLGHWWRVFHERFWSIRGMENLMLDYFDEMENLKKLGRSLLDYHKQIVDRYAALGFDGILTSDDLGHQSGPFMSPAIFRDLYFPLYKELAEHIHGHGMHFWLHSCGDNGPLMDQLIEAGLDVFHPVQKGCMDEKATADRFGDRISFLAGIDVQHLLPEGSVEEVRRGIREFIDCFYKPEGGLLLAAGNGIMPDTPLENIEAMLEEISLYKP